MIVAALGYLPPVGGALRVPAAMNIWADGNGENTNTARLATAPVLLLASVWPSAVRLARRSGDNRPRSLRVPTASTRRPPAAAKRAAGGQGGGRAVVPLKAGEHEHGPGRGAESGQQVDGEHDPDHRQQMKNGRRHERST